MPSSTSSSRPRPPGGFLLALLLAAVVEGGLWQRPGVVRFAARYTPPGPDGDALITDAALTRIPTDETPLLLLGSSQVREGLDCAVFEARLPKRPCLNLAISGGSPTDMLYIQRRLDPRLRRRTVVVAIFPRVLHKPVKTGFVDGETVGLVLGRSEWRAVAAQEWRDVFFGLLQFMLPSLRYKDSLRAAWDVVGADPRAAWELRMPSQPNRLLIDAAPQPARYYQLRRGIVDPDIHITAFTPVQEAALLRLLDNEAALGGRAIVVDFPTRPGFETTLAAEVAAQYRGLVARLRDRKDVVFVPAERLGPLTEADFLDFSHLAESGRAQVSERLAAIVAAEAPPPR